MTKKLRNMKVEMESNQKGQPKDGKLPPGWKIGESYEDQERRIAEEMERASASEPAITQGDELTRLATFGLSHILQNAVRHSVAQNKARVDIKLADEWVSPQRIMDALESLPFYYETSVSSTGSFDLFVWPASQEPCCDQEAWLRTMVDPAEPVELGIHAGAGASGTETVMPCTGRFSSEEAEG